LKSASKDARMSDKIHSDRPLDKAPELSFVLMDNLMDEFSVRTRGRQAGKVERIAMAVGVAGALVGILLSWLLPKPFDLYAAIIGLAIECLGFAVGILLSFKRDWRSIRYARKDSAESMDSDFLKYEDYVQRLRQFPVRDRARRHRYIRERGTRMMSRTRLFTGGMERLGVFPLLLALYIQLKDWRFGDWAALNDITMTQGILIFALMLAYLLFLHLMHIHSRIEAIELLLNEAAERDREESSPELTLVRKADAHPVSAAG